MVGKTTTVNKTAFEAICIVGSESKDYTDELKEGCKRNGIKVIEVEGDRGISFATTVQGSDSSVARAVEDAPILSKKQKRQILKELRNGK